MSSAAAVIGALRVKCWNKSAKHWANIVDPDQTAPKGVFRSGSALSALSLRPFIVK